MATGRLRQWAQAIKNEVTVYRAVLSHPRTPRLAKWLLGLAMAYLVSPVDIIPDFIPVTGHLDDLLIVPLLVWLALRMIPSGVVEECRAKVRQREDATKDK